MEYSIVICDDDPNQANEIKQMVERAQMILSDEDKIEFNFNMIGHSYQEVADYLTKNQLDGAFYFLDIELSNQAGARDGLDLAQLAKSRDDKAQIIIVTTHEELSLMTFQRRIGPLDYIVKGNQDAMQKRITETLRLAMKNVSELNFSKKMTFSYKLGHLIKNINVDDVLYIETSEFPHKLLLVQSNGTADFVGDINSVAEKNDFLIKVSRSYLVNPKNIKEK